MKKTDMTSKVGKRLHIIAFPLFFATFAGYAWEAGFVFELFSHYALHYLVVSIFGLVVALITRRKLAALLFSIIVLWNLFLIFPYLGLSSARKPGKILEFSIINANVLSKNTNYGLFTELVQRIQPDFVLLQEVNQNWINGITALDKIYPYKHMHPRGDNFGIGILSKKPFQQIRIVRFGELEIPNIVADINLGASKTLRIVCTHPVPPMSNRFHELRNKQIEKISKFIRQEKVPVILAGDLNLTMYSPAYQKFLMNGFTNARRGKGLYGTWPSFAGAFGIPIDHLIFTSPIRCLEFYSLDDIQSDHRPIFGRFGL